MNRSDKQRVEELFEAALDCDTGKRLAFVAAECRNQPAIFEEVKSLLTARASARDDSFLNAPAFEMQARFFAEDEKENLPAERTIGHYKIVERIGAGGMGTVYKAVRADEEYETVVAVKLIKRGMDTDYILNRFKNERQILANLNHPNIARLLEGGTTEDGLPYFVMEYIEGRPLNEYCDEKKLSIKERLELFRTICSAVQYAHRNLVIHRDIKPSNILVTADGTPKLLDFGIAKILHNNSDAETARTATELRVLTPEYASPEQVRGEAVNVSSDVYSLGVVLYELLTGHRPYRFKSRRPDEIAKIICEQEPEKPSTAANRVAATKENDEKSATESITERVGGTRESSLQKWRRGLRGDLDNIVLLAMRKEPEQRYESVEEFSADISRHLQDLPVRARKATLAYQSVNFLKRKVIRNWRSSLTLLLLFFVVAAAASWLSVYFLGNKKDTIAATTNFKSIAVLPFKYIGDLERDDNPLLGVGLADYLINRLGQTRKLEVRPMSAVQTYAGGVSPRPIGQNLGVDAVLSGSIRRDGDAVSIAAELISVSDGHVIWKQLFSGNQQEIVSLQNNLFWELMETLSVRLTDAEQSALTNNRTNNAKAYELYVRGRYLWNKRTKEDYEKAIEYFNQAVAIDPNYADAYAGLADAYALLACRIPYDGRPEKMRLAKDYARRALSLDETMASPHATLGFIGWHYDWDWAASDREFIRAIELDPSYATARQWYAFLLVRIGRFDEAIAQMKQARDLDPLSFIMHQDYTDVLYHARHYDEAIEAARKTLELAPDNQGAREMMGEAFYHKGDFENYLNQIQEIVRVKGRQADTLKLLAGAYFRLNRKSEGQKVLSELKPHERNIEDAWIAYFITRDEEKLFAGLESEYRNRSAGVTSVHNHPGWDDVRSHPRIQEYIRLTGLSEYEIKLTNLPKS